MPVASSRIDDPFGLYALLTLFEVLIATMRLQFPQSDIYNRSLRISLAVSILACLKIKELARLFQHKY